MKAIYDFQKIGIKLKALFVLMILLASFYQASAGGVITTLSTTAAPTPICKNQPYTLTGNMEVNPVINLGVTINWVWEFSGGETYSTTTTSHNSPAESATITPIAATISGTFTLTVTFVDGGTMSETANTAITVIQAPDPVAISGGLASYCLGASVSLTANATGTIPFTYNWSGGASGTNSTTTFPAQLGEQPCTVTVYSSTCSLLTTAATFTYTGNALPTPTITPNPASVCVNATVDLSAGTWSNTAWSSSDITKATVAGTTTGTVTGVASGSPVITVTVVDANGCSASTTATVTVNALPTPVINHAGGTAVCVNVTDQYSTSGGTYSTTVWSIDNVAIATINSSTGLLTGVSQGSATVTVIVTDLNGCSGTATRTAYVNGLPTPPTITPNPASVCVNATVDLSAGTWSNTAWSSSDITKATVAGTTTGTVTGVASGAPVIMVTVTGANGCTNTSTREVTVNPLPVATASSSSPVCVGSTLNLYGGTATATATYSWTGPGTYTSTTEDPIISNVSSADAGAYNLTVTDGNGCASTATSTTVVVNALPTPTINGVSDVCVGSSTTYTATGGTYSPTIWAVTASASIDASGLLTGLTDGIATITVTVTDANGCTASTTKDVTVHALPIPVISPSLANVCIGSTQLFTTVATYTSTTWTTSQPAVATIHPTSGLLTGVAAGSCSVFAYVTDGNGCGATTSTAANVTVHDLPVATASNNGPVCVGRSLVLTGSGTMTTTTYSWSGPNSFTSAAQSPEVSTSATIAMDGVYTLYVNNGTCSSTAATTTVTVVPSTEITVNPTPQTICDGGTASFSVVVDPALPVPLYRWYQQFVTDPVTAFVAMDDIPGTFSGTHSPTLTVTGTYAMNGRNYECHVVGCGDMKISLPALLTVRALPVVTFTAQPGASACTGSDVTYTTQTGMTNYLWTVPGSEGTAYSITSGGTSSSSSTVTLKYLTAGSKVVQINYTDANGCTATSTTSSTPTNVVVAPVATISGNSCTGTTLTALPAGKAYLWAGPGGFTSTSQEITPNVAGAYTVTVSEGVCGTSTTTTVLETPTATITGNSCTGSTLTAGPDGMTYSWTGPGGFTSTSQTITPNVAGNYTVTVSNGVCGTSTTTSVNTTPVASITTDGLSCTGVTLTGHSTVSPATYAWTTPSGTSTATSLTATTAGTYTLIVTATMGSCSSTATSTTIYATPTALITGTPCTGSTLTGNPTSGVTYSWNIPGGGTATTPTITAAVAGTYTLTVTSTLGGSCVSMANYAVSETPIATISGSLCTGSTLTALPADKSYLWAGPGGFTSTSQSITPNVEGDYTVTVTYLGCGTSTTTTVKATPVATITGTLCKGSTLTAGPIVDGYTYQWGGGSTATSTTITATVTGTYTLYVYNGSCASTMTSTTVNDVPTILVNENGASRTVCKTSALSPNIVYNLGAGATSASITTGTLPNGLSGVFASGSPSTFTISGTVSSTATATDYPFTVTAVGTGGCSATATGTITVAPITQITTQPIPQTVCEGGSTSFTIVYTPLVPTPSSIQWYVQTTTGGPYDLILPSSIYSGVTTTTLVITGATISMNGYRYLCRVSGCGDPQVSDNAGLTVLALPTSTISGASSVCVGSTTQLEATGGPWSSTSWSSSMPGYATVSNTGLVTGLASGTTVISLVVNNGTCSSTVTTKSITVNALPTPGIGGTTSVCAGSTTTLTATGGSFVTTLWSSDNTGVATIGSTSGIVTGQTAGTAVITLTVLDGNGCSGSVTATVTVNALPAPTITPSTASVCINSTITLSAGTWSSTTWTSSDVTKATVTSGGLVTGIAAGTPVITVTVINANGCTASTTRTVTVNALPAPVINGVSSICKLSTTTYTATGGTYSPTTWTSSNTAVATIGETTGILAGLTAGSTMITVTVTDENGCLGTNTKTVTVTELPVTNITGTTTLCFGFTSTLTASGTWSNTAWSSSDETKATVSSGGVVTGVAAGTAVITVTVTNANGCVGTASTTVTVLALPVATASNNGPVCSGTELNLLGGPDGMSSYSWTGPGSFSSNSQNPTVSSSATINMQGTYTLTVNNGTCSSTSATTIVTVVPSTSIVDQPTDKAVCVGGTTSFSATITPELPLPTYRWYRQLSTGGSFVAMEDGTADGGTYSGTHTLTLIVSNAQASMNGFHFELHVVGCGEMKISTNALLTVNAVPVASATNNGPVCTGAPVTLSGSATGSGTMQYAWSGPGGYTSDVQNPVISPAVNGTYSLIVNNGTCASTATTTTVVVNIVPVATAANNGPLCVGSTLNLTGGPATGVSYAWTGPGTFSSTSQSPSITNVTTGNAGAYVLTVTSLTTGCVSAAASTTVTINALPVASASNTGPVCTGSSVTLNGSATGGGTMSYAWTGPAGYTSAVQNPVINPAVAGTYTLTVNNGCGSLPSATVVVVNTVPVATATNNGPVCTGSSVTLTGGPASGVTYAWTGPGTYSSTTQSPVINPAVAGTYTLTVFNGNCYSTPVATTVVVNTAPVATATNSGPVCYGSSVALTGGPSSGVTYAWTGPGTYSSTIQSPVINPAVAGTYTLTVYNGTCYSTPVTTTVVVNALPNPSVLGASSVCIGFTTPLTAVGSWNTVTWQSSNSAIATISSSGIVTGVSAGPVNITLTVTDANGCQNSTIHAMTVTAVPTIVLSSVVGTDAQTVQINTAITHITYAIGAPGTGATSIGLPSGVSGTFSGTTYTIQGTPTAAGTFTYTVSTTGGACQVSATGSITVTEPATQYIAGYVNYNNTHATPLNNVHVELINPVGGAVIASTITAPDGVGAAGYFVFTNVPSGNYRLAATFPTGVWGGNNATDALIVQQVVIGTKFLYWLRYIVADVDGNSVINTADAGFINERVVGNIDYYPAGDWKLTDTTFTHATISNVNLKALCVGDVNGSYTNPVKSASFLTAVEDEVMTVPVNKMFTYNIKSNAVAELGAMTLFMNYDESRFSVDKVNSTLGGISYRIENGRLALAWANTNSLKLNPDETVISLNMTAKEVMPEPVQVFEINGGSEFADPFANRIDNFDLKMAKVASTSADLTFSMVNYPNPFTNSTEIVYTIPVDGKVRLVLTNMFGQAIRTLVDQKQAAGTYKVKVKADEGYLTPGLYLYSIDVEGETETFNKTNKMLLTR